jgi:hypothetical protein
MESTVNRQLQGFVYIVSSPPCAGQTYGEQSPCVAYNWRCEGGGDHRAAETLAIPSMSAPSSRRQYALITVRQTSWLAGRVSVRVCMNVSVRARVSVSVRVRVQVRMLERVSVYVRLRVCACACVCACVCTSIAIMYPYMYWQ